MGRLTYLKGERSKSRKKLKKYLILFGEEISEESGIQFPTKEQIRLFSSEEFDCWFVPIANKVKSNVSEDLILIELIECYLCSVNNVASAEMSNTNDIYF